MDRLLIPITALAAAWILGALFTKMLIPFLEKKQFRQFVREEGPQSHLSKTGTPSMGGIAIVSATILSAVIVTLVLAADMADYMTLAAVLATMVLFGLIGFIDDYEKAIRKNNAGISPKQKIILQFTFSLLFAVFAYFKSGFSGVSGSSVWIPIADVYLDFGIFYIPFIIFVMIAFSNAVNLTDGLDGLASGVTALVAFCMILLGVYASPDFATEPVIYGALAGGCLGFLMFNKNPAKIFMGDTGSMALGGMLAAGAVMLKMEFLLAIAGLVYVLEALSVIIQVTYYKKTHKRIFKMAPLHHHFELCGMKEKQVVLMFWGAALVFCILAIVVSNL